jgi:ABC-type antimicrobial peptide transport system permease subunit
MFFFIDYGRTNYLNVRLNPEVGTQEALASIESVIKKHDPVSPFTYSFADEQYARKFGNEMRVGKLAGIFAALAIFISCMGLLGMASYMAEQRTKEIGIRKVLGASVTQLWQLMTRDFVLLVSVAVVVAVPLAYYLMKEWLQNYHYRIDISWLVFAIAALGAVMVTIVTVSFQTIKSAVANPVDSLRSE